MARKRCRSPRQKLKRKFKDRLSTLQSKIEELNTIQTNRAILVWTEEGRTLAFGDERLLESLSHAVQLQPNPTRRPTLSPTNSFSSAASPDRESQRAQEASKDRVSEDRVFDRDLPREKEPQVVRQWRKEDLDFLAADFFY
jgi:hypothetical protein